MRYMIVKTWDENMHPAAINSKDTEAEAQELVDHIRNNLGYPDAFYATHPGTEESAYLTVDPVNQTISYNSSQHTIDELLPKLAAYRYEIETGGITTNGMTIQTDRQSRSDITAARIKAQEDSTYNTKWKTPDGFVTLDAIQILAIADAVHNHVQAAFDAESTVEDEIKNGTLTNAGDVKTRFDELMA